MSKTDNQIDWPKEENFAMLVDQLDQYQNTTNPQSSLDRHEIYVGLFNRVKFFYIFCLKL